MRANNRSYVASSSGPCERGLEEPLSASMADGRETNVRCYGDTPGGATTADQTGRGWSVDVGDVVSRASPQSPDEGGDRDGNTVPSYHLPVERAGVSKSFLSPDPTGDTNRDRSKIGSRDYFVASHPRIAVQEGGAGKQDTAVPKLTIVETGYVGGWGGEVRRVASRRVNHPSPGTAYCDTADPRYQWSGIIDNTSWEKDCVEGQDPAAICHREVERATLGDNEHSMLDEKERSNAPSRSQGEEEAPTFMQGRLCGPNENYQQGVSGGSEDDRCGGGNFFGMLDMSILFNS